MEHEESIFWEGMRIVSYLLDAEGEEIARKAQGSEGDEFLGWLKSARLLDQKMEAIEKLCIGKKGIRKREISCLLNILQAKNAHALSNYFYQWAASDFRLARDVTRCLTGNSRDAGYETRGIMLFLSEICQTRNYFDLQDINGLFRNRNSTKKGKTKTRYHFKVLTFFSHPSKGFNLIVQNESVTNSTRSFFFTRKGLGYLKKYRDVTG